VGDDRRRRVIGYGGQPTRSGSARIVAININLNFEGGGVRSVMDGD